MKQKDSKKMFYGSQNRSTNTKPNILCSRFDFSIKNFETANERYKASLVDQGNTDVEIDLLIHDSTNLRHSSLHVIVSVAPTIELDYDHRT